MAASRESGDTAPKGIPISYATATRAPAAAPGPDALQQVAHGLGDDLVAGVTAVEGSAGARLTVDLVHNDGDIPSEWTAELAAGAYAELTRGGEPSFSDMVESVRAVGPDDQGRTTTTPVGTGAARLGQQFGSPPDATLTAAVDDAATRYGLHVADVRVLHPLESAVDVTYVVPDGTIGWTIDELCEAITGSTPDVEGILIQLESPSGQLLLRSSASYRTGDGSLWFAPGQDSRFGAAHGVAPWVTR